MHIAEPTAIDSWLGHYQLSGIPILSFIAAGIGAYLGEYLKKKGEILATKEAFDELKEQTRQLTQTTKEIESKISTDAWDRQQQWQLRRDLLYDLMRQAGRLFDAFFAACQTGAGPGNRTGNERDKWIKENRDNDATLKELLDKITDFMFLSRIICSDTLIAEIGEFHNFVQELFMQSSLGNASLHLWVSHYKSEFKKRNNALIMEIRKELRITSEPSTAPQSNDSSATPILGSQAPNSDTQDQSSGRRVLPLPD